MNLSKNIFPGVFALLLMAGCSKKDSLTSSSVDILSFSVCNSCQSAVIDNTEYSIRLRVPDTIVNGKNLAATFTLSPGAVATIDNVDQVSGITKNDFEKDLQYVIRLADRYSSHSWTVLATNNDYSLGWGLGRFINQSYTVDRDYDWYLDQGLSGDFAIQNCGPASVTMAIRWADSTFAGTAADARAKYKADGGWWYTDDAGHYLTDKNINHAFLPLSESPDVTGRIMTNILDHGELIILCIDMNVIRAAADSSYHVDKFYATTPNWGHFFVVKGYKRADHALFFEVYDPYSFGHTNTDHTPKGLNRFYRVEDVAAASLHWWNYAIVVARKGLAVSPEVAQISVNPSGIPHAHGL